MANVLIEVITKALVALLLTLISVGGTWLTIKLQERTQLGNIQISVESVINMAQLTVMELQQTVVEGMKNAHADNKLTREEIAMLGNMLIDKTLEKLSTPTYDLITAAGVDIEALIHGAGEAWINRLKGEANIITAANVPEDTPVYTYTGPAQADTE